MAGPPGRVCSRYKDWTGLEWMRFHWARKTDSEGKTANARERVGLEWSFQVETVGEGVLKGGLRCVGEVLRQCGLEKTRSRSEYPEGLHAF